jgi:hypothetical protein
VGDGFASAGFTHDVSPTGMFICSSSIPEIKMPLTLTLATPDGRKLRLRGVIVRVFRVAANLRQAVPNGFCVRLVEAPEDYFVLLAELLHLQLPEEPA